MDLEARVDKHDEMFADVRERLSKIEARLEHMATKEDLKQLESTLVKWVIGTTAGACIAAITIMTFVLNNAVPKAPPTPSAPIIIQLPPYKS